MQNIFLIISSDKVVIDYKIEEIINKNKDSSILKYDLETTPIDHLIEDLDTYNFLENKKIVIGMNASFLSGGKKEDSIHNLDLLDKYLTNPSSDNILILVTDSIDKKKKLVNHLLANCTLIETDIDIKKLIKKNLADYVMSDSAINLLIEYCNDKERVITELEKLKTYKLDEKEITCEDIKNVVSKNIDDNVYSLIDNILNGRKKESYEIYNDMILKGEQVANIISKLANKIRLIYQVKVFLEEGKSDLEISKLLKMHAYPIKLARESSYKYSEKLLLQYLDKLATLDYNLKSGNSDASIIFEVFIAEI